MVVEGVDMNYIGVSSIWANELGRSPHHTLSEKYWIC